MVCWENLSLKRGVCKYIELDEQTFVWLPSLRGCLADTEWREDAKLTPPAEQNLKFIIAKVIVATWFQCSSIPSEDTYGPIIGRLLYTYTFYTLRRWLLCSLHSLRFPGYWWSSGLLLEMKMTRMRSRECQNYFACTVFALWMCSVCRVSHDLTAVHYHAGMHN